MKRIGLSAAIVVSMGALAQPSAQLGTSGLGMGMSCGKGAARWCHESSLGVSVVVSDRKRWTLRSLDIGYELGAAKLGQRHSGLLPPIGMSQAHGEAGTLHESYQGAMSLRYEPTWFLGLSARLGVRSARNSQDTTKMYKLSSQERQASTAPYGSLGIGLKLGDGMWMVLRKEYWRDRPALRLGVSAFETSATLVFGSEY